MKVPERTWIRYIEALRKINDAAADAMEKYLQTHALETVADKLTASEYAYAIATQFGEGAAAMACEMYDAMAGASGAALSAAEPAATPTLKDVKDTIFGSTSKYKSAGRIPGEIGRLVKRTGVDTTMQNAIRDNAEWAWIPHGDTCPFCIALASRGWQKASRAAMKGDHAEHIHANCDCTYAIRFNKKTEYAGYNPERYADIYNNAEGRSAREKINSLKRAQYAENAPRIRAQKRAAYAERTAEKMAENMVVSLAEEGHRGKNRNTEIARSIIESPDYGRRLSSIDENSAVTKAIIEKSREILKHRSGTEFEDLMFIDINSGDYLVRTDYDVPRRVEPSKRMKRMVKDADDYTIAALHNHSGSSVPSPADIKSLVQRKNAYGVILCHDGSIYKYACTEFNAPAYQAAVDKINKIEYTKEAVNAFIGEAKTAGVNIEVL